eukprot:1519309-Lingulodinium_polyedra.AAC.1
MEELHYNDGLAEHNLFWRGQLDAIMDILCQVRWAFALNHFSLYGCVSARLCNLQSVSPRNQ